MNGGPFEPSSVPKDGTLLERLNIDFVETSPEKIVATMPVAGNMQPFGVLHGGATAALCESAASLGAALTAGSERIALGLEINVNHLRSVSAGSVTAIAVPLHSGATTSVWEVRVHDDLERLTAVSRVTLTIRDKRH